MTTAVVPDAWQEVFMVGIQIKGGTEVQFAGIIENITGIELAEKDIEGVPMANGGRTTTWKPQGDQSITLKIWPVDGALSGSGMIQLFNPQSTADSTEPILVENTRLRNKHQVIVSWAEDLASYSTAGQASTLNQAAQRMTAKNAYCTVHNFSNDDMNLSAEVTFKWTAFAKDATSNFKFESTKTTPIPIATSFT